ncbi:MAG: APC family permease [Oculatellaceae cyanobacterium bins.114]|nr:APC family permease [Oculatellaceae cyanobacterium bins.114]
MTVDVETKATSGLRSDCLPFRDVLAQSVANIAPTASPTVNIALVFASAGGATWFAYVIATVGLVFVSFNINQFARRSASPGSLYSYIAKGLGSTVGVLSGWALVLAYLFTAMAVLSGFANYGEVLFQAVGLAISPIFLFAICAGLAWYIAYKDIELSASLMLALEVVSVGLILLLGIIVLAHHGFAIDTAQLSLQGMSGEGLRLGLVLAIFSYVGFESATALGDEAKSPLTTIPRSVLSSTILAGLFFVFMSYIQVLGFNGSPVPMNESDAPLNYLATQAGVPALGFLTVICAMVSFFACALASINAGSRIFFSMARHGIFHPSIGQAHSDNQTPHVAVTMTTLFVFLVTASMSMFGVTPLDIYFFLGTIATYGFLLAYILVSIAAPVYLYRERELKPLDVVISVISVVFMIIPTVGSIYPVPPTPFNVFPYLFLMYLVAGGCWFLMLRLHSPEVIEDMEEAIEAVHTKFNEMKKV